MSAAAIPRAPVSNGVHLNGVHLVAKDSPEPMPVVAVQTAPWAAKQPMDPGMDLAVRHLARSCGLKPSEGIPGLQKRIAQFRDEFKADLSGLQHYKDLVGRYEVEIEAARQELVRLGPADKTDTEGAIEARKRCHGTIESNMHARELILTKEVRPLSARVSELTAAEALLQILETMTKDHASKPTPIPEVLVLNPVN